MNNAIKRKLMSVFFLLAAVCICMTAQPAKAADCAHTNQVDLRWDAYKQYYGHFGVPVPDKPGYHYNATVVCASCGATIEYDTDSISCCADVMYYSTDVDPTYVSNNDEATHKMTVQCLCGQMKSWDVDCTWEFVKYVGNVAEYETEYGYKQYVHYKTAQYKCSLCGQTKVMKDESTKCTFAHCVADETSPKYEYYQLKSSNYHYKVLWYCEACDLIVPDKTKKISCKSCAADSTGYSYSANWDGTHTYKKACDCGREFTYTDDCGFKDDYSYIDSYKSKSSTKHTVYTTTIQYCPLCRQTRSVSSTSTASHNFEAVSFNEHDSNSTYHWTYDLYECKNCGYQKQVVDEKEKHSYNTGYYSDHAHKYVTCSDGTSHQILQLETCSAYLCNHSAYVAVSSAKCTTTNKKTTTTKYNKTYHKVTTTWDINCKACGNKKTGLSSTKKVKHTFSKKTVTKHNSTYHWTVTTYTCSVCGYSYSVTGTKVKHTMKTSGTTYKKVANSSPEKHTKTVTKACTCGYKSSTSTKEKCNSSNTLTSHYYSSESKCKKVTCWTCSKCGQGVWKNNQLQKVTYESHSRKWVGSKAVGGSLSYKCSKCSHVFATESSFYKDVTIKASENTKTIKFPISKYDSVSSIKVTYSKYLSITKKTSNSFTVKPLARGNWKLKNGDWVSSDTWVTVKLKSGIFYTYCFEIEP